MGSKLRNAIKKVEAASGLTGGRTSIKCSELATKYPQGIFVTGIGSREYKGSKYYVVTFAEEPDKYFGAGQVLTQKIDQLLEEYDGDFEEMNRELEEDNIQLFLAKKRSNKGNDYIDARFGGYRTVKPVATNDIPYDVSSYDEIQEPFYTGMKGEGE